MDKKPIFNPLADTNLGKLICEIWASDSKEKSNQLSIALYSNFSVSELKFTTRAEKEVIYNILAQKYRKLIEEKKFTEMETIFRQLLCGTSELSKKVPRVDVSFEFLEWFLIGFDNDELILKMISIIFNHKISFSEDFIQVLKQKYNEYMQAQS